MWLILGIQHVIISFFFPRRKMTTMKELSWYLCLLLGNTGTVSCCSCKHDRVIDTTVMPITQTLTFVWLTWHSATIFDSYSFFSVETKFFFLYFFIFFSCSLMLIMQTIADLCKKWWHCVTLITQTLVDLHLLTCYVINVTQCQLFRYRFAIVWVINVTLTFVEKKNKQIRTATEIKVRRVGIPTEKKLLLSCGRSKVYAQSGLQLWSILQPRFLACDSADNMIIQSANIKSCVLLSLLEACF